MLKRWLFRAVAVLGVSAALFLAYAVVLKLPPVARAVNNPAFCAGCHVMDQQYASHAASSHRSISCNDCHVAHGFLRGAWSEAESGARHLAIYVTGTTPDPIRALNVSRSRVQENCVVCHAATVRTVGDTHRDGGVYCFACHRSTPHDRPYKR